MSQYHFYPCVQVGMIYPGQIGVPFISILLRIVMKQKGSETREAPVFVFDL